MKKKLFFIVALMLILTLCLTACQPKAKTYKLTLYDSDGQTVLQTIEVEEGKAPTKPVAPTKDGYEFVGWFITPTNKTEYDFTKALTEDANAYARWKTAGYEDNRDWVIVGDFNGWAAAEGYHLTKKSGAGNLFEITLDIQADQQFKFTVLRDDGILDYNDKENGADVSFIHVVNPDENFEGKGGIGDTPKNISCLIAGNYTFTLTSDPDRANNSVSFVRNGDVSQVAPEIVIATYIIKGSKITGWADKTDAEYQMTKGADGKFSLEIELYANDEFMFVGYEQKDGALTSTTKYIKSDVLSADSCEQIIANGDNMKTTADGTYTFVYDAEAKSLKVSYSAEHNLPSLERPTTWFILGNGAQAGSVLKEANWGLTNEERQKLSLKAGSENVYEITLDLFEGDEWQICSSSGWSDKHGFDSIVNPGENFSKGGNVTVKVSGNYTLTLTIADNEADDKIEWVRNGDTLLDENVVVMDYYIKGAKITDWKDFYSPSTQMTKVSEGVYELSVYLVEGEEFMFTSTSTSGGATSVGTVYLRSTNFDETSKALFDETSSKNIIAKASGNYKFTYTESTGVLTAEKVSETAPTDADYYIDGTFGSNNWDCPFKAEFKLTQDATNPYLYTISGVELDEGKQIIIQAFKAGATERGEWGTDTYTGLGSYNYKYLFNGGDSFSAVDTGNQNIKILKASTYKISFNSYSKMITIEDENIADDAYIKGSMTGGGWGIVADWKMTYDASTQKYTITKEFAVGDEFGIMIAVGNTTAQRAWVGKSNVSGEPAGFDLSGGNIKCTVAGSYTITVDMSGESPVVTIQ